MKRANKQAHPPHMALETRRKLTERVVDNLAPWDLKIYKATGRLPRPRLGHTEAKAEHKIRMMFKKHMRGLA